MPRLIVLALATALLVLPTTAGAQTTSDPSAGGTGSCADSADAAAATPASATGDSPSGGTPDSGPDIAPASSGGTGTSISPGSSGGVAGETASGGSASGAPPLAGAAQEPEPEPEGPGQEQPEEPGGEPQDPTGEEPVEGGEGGETGGGLPRTGLAVLQLLLLGVVLVLVGARLRVLLKRRRDARDEPEPDAPADLEPDGLPREDAVVAYRQPADDLEENEEYEYDEAGYAEEDGHTAELEHADDDEWTFPDPDEPAPTGLLPSTAIARRQARLRQEHSEPGDD